MEPDLSEFSYGFALTSELIAKFHLKRAGAPEFATQNAEGKPGGGWDMKLPSVPIYLQFKRSDEMRRRTAREATLFGTLPFYRMHLRRKDLSDQHQLMLDLEAGGKHVSTPLLPLRTPINSASATPPIPLLSVRYLFVRQPLAHSRTNTSTT